MSAQHTPGPKVHMLNVTGGRAVCRYAARPSRRVRAVPRHEFAAIPVDQRCAECEAKYRAAIAKATGSQHG